MMSDAALDALLLPLNQRLLAEAPETLFLRAREGAALHARGQRERLHCVQPFKPWADALARARFDVVAEAADARVQASSGWALAEQAHRMSVVVL